MTGVDGLLYVMVGRILKARSPTEYISGVHSFGKNLPEGAAK